MFESKFKNIPNVSWEDVESRISSDNSKWCASTSFYFSSFIKENQENIAKQEVKNKQKEKIII